jgi:serine phosphatase RsbU (regulator of sigma subunit)
MAPKDSSLPEFELNKTRRPLDPIQKGGLPGFKVDLTSLIGHREQVQADQPLLEVYRALSSKNIDFIAVLNKEIILGICSRAELGSKMEQKESLEEPADQKAQGLLTASCLRFSDQESIVDILNAAFARCEKLFYDDILLVDKEGKYLGLLPVRMLVILQNRYFMDNINRISQQKNETERNMELARQLQLAMLPNQHPIFPSYLPAEKSRLKFHHTYFSPDILGGDFFHIVYLSGERAGLFMCDVLGHNISSALVVSMMRALVEGYRSIADNPGELLTRINQKFIEMLSSYPDTMYATANYLVVDVKLKQFEYANAGHPIAIKINNKTGYCDQLKFPIELIGPPLGILKNMKYETAVGPIEKQDLFLTYTDGLYEVFDEQQEQFGIQRLINTFSRHKKKAPKALFESVIQEVETFTQSHSFTDDVCLVGVEIADLFPQDKKP